MEGRGRGEEEGGGRGGEGEGGEGREGKREGEEGRGSRGEGRGDKGEGRGSTLRDCLDSLKNSKGLKHFLFSLVQPFQLTCHAKFAPPPIIRPLTELKQQQKWFPLC